MKRNVLLVTKVSDKVHSFGVNCRLKFKEQAERWSKVKIHKSNKEYIYIYIDTHLYIANWMAQKSSLGNHMEVVRENLIEDT